MSGEDEYRAIPIVTTLELIGGKYKALILWALMDGRRRFGEIHCLMPSATSSMLSRQLKELEADGLVRKTVVSENPPWVEYSLTSLGTSLMPVIEEMALWGAAYLEMESSRAQ